jgi:hypothetical protein
MSQAIVVLRSLTHTDLTVVTPWFDDPDNQRFLGGPQWPAAMLAAVRSKPLTTRPGRLHEVTARLVWEHRGAVSRVVTLCVWGSLAAISPGRHPRVQCRRTA